MDGKGRVAIISAQQAAELVQESQTLVTSGYIGAGFPEDLVWNLARRFEESGYPGDLTLVHAAGQGNWRDRGLGVLARPGLLRKVIAGYYATSPEICDLVAEDLIEAYTFPQGVITQLFRNTAAGKPGLFTHIGLGTFVDPRIEGGKLNRVTTNDLVELAELGGRQLLFYPAFHLDVAFIRGTTADLNGNVSMEKEAATLEHLAIAQATRHCGGVVVAQVERLAQVGSLDPQRVKIPGNLVDYVVVAEPNRHWQTFDQPFDPALTGDVKSVLDGREPMALTADKVMARRAAFEMRPGDVVNMYHGESEALARVALEEGLLDRIHLTVAAGAAGGMPAGGLSYGLAYNPEAILDQASMFDFYHGGGLDLAVMPMVQVDRQGNVNVTRYGRTIKGCGSFVDVSQSARRVVFVGSHTIGSHVNVGYGRVIIRREGRPRRFVDRVEQMSFSADEARRRGQQVLYVTERALYELGTNGLVLREVAPGVDLERDVLGVMAFRPEVPGSIRSMDEALFRLEAMGLIDRMQMTPGGVA